MGSGRDEANGGDSHTGSTTVLHSGYLVVLEDEARHIWKARYCRLYENHLASYEHQSLTTPRTTFVFDGSTTLGIEVRDAALQVLIVANAKKTLQICAPDANSSLRWIAGLRLCIKYCDNRLHREKDATRSRNLDQSRISGALRSSSEQAEDEQLLFDGKLLRMKR